MTILKFLIFLLIPIQMISETSLIRIRNVINESTTISESDLKPVVERVFVRKKRFLLLPKGAHLKFTVSLSKHLLAMFPRGFNFGIEAALYYPAPTARIDLIPKRLRPKTTPKPNTSAMTEPIIVHIPGSYIRYKAKPAAKPMKVQRIDNNATGTLMYDTSKYQKYQNYANRVKLIQPSKYDQQEYNWVPRYVYNELHPWHQSLPTKWTKWMNQQPTATMQRQTLWPVGNTIRKFPTYPQSTRWQRAVKDALSNVEYFTNKDDTITDNDFDGTLPEPMFFSDLEPFTDWKHYHNHRERRDLFYQFEGLSTILGIDMKSCILRAICDGKRFLLPPGHSMIQDILRVVFQFPTISGLADDYSRSMQADFDTCHKKLKNTTCPFSLLDWFIHSHKKI